MFNRDIHIGDKDKTESVYSEKKTKSKMKLNYC